MKKFLSVVISMFLCVSLFAACSGGGGDEVIPTPPKEIVFSSFEPITLKLNQPNADLLAGVTAKQGENTVPITVDKTKVDFTKSGEYEIKYTADTIVKTNKVFVYGMPTFLFDNKEIVSNKVNISYGDASLNNEFKNNIKAKDSFGKALVATFVEGRAFNGEYGDYIVKYTAKDKANNIASASVTYTVITDGAPIINDVSCDLFMDLIGGDIAIPVVLNATSMELYNGSALADSSAGGDYEYNSTTSKLHLAADFVKTLGVGTHALKVKTEKGYASFNINVTDNYPTYATLAKPSSATANIEIFTTSAGVNLLAGEKVWKYNVTGNSEFNNRIELGGALGTKYDPRNCKTISFDFYVANSDKTNPLFYDNANRGNVSKYFDILEKKYVAVDKLSVEKWYTISVDMPEYWSRFTEPNGLLIMLPADHASLTAYIKNIAYTKLVSGDMIYSKTATLVKASDEEKQIIGITNTAYKYTAANAIEDNNGLYFRSIAGSTSYDFAKTKSITLDVYITDGADMNQDITGINHIFYTTASGGDKIISRKKLLSDFTVDPADTNEGTGNPDQWKVQIGNWYRMTFTINGLTNGYLSNCGDKTMVAYFANIQYNLV